MNKYKKLRAYLDYLAKTYNLNFCIKDFVGFICVDKQLDAALRPYLGHTNPYCMYVKQDRTLYFKCLSMMRPMVLKSEQLRRSFYGVCVGGVGEYTVPIICDDVAIGAINIGFFPPEKPTTSFLIKRFASHSEIVNYDNAMKYYNEYITPAKIAPDHALNLLEIVSEYLSATYVMLKSTHTDIGIGKKKRNSSEDTIISHALEYISKNFINKFTVTDIADFCHCSESYINHIFKRRLGISISTYTNKIRIENSKSLLLTSTKSIKEIAMAVGFMDPNYFSKVFTDLVGIPASEFRRRY